MKNNKLRAIIITAAVITGISLQSDGVVARAHDFIPDEVNSISSEMLKQDYDDSQSPIINGIRVKKRLIDKNYEKGFVTTPTYIVIHDTANTRPGADAMANRNYFATTDNEVSAHYIIDDSNIVQALEDNWKGWHVGDGGTGAAINNANTIGIELAVNSDGDFDKTYATGIELTRELMRKHNIPADRVVMHKHASGKNCSNVMIVQRPNLWEQFKQKIAVGMPGEELINDGIAPTSKGQVVNVSSYLTVRTGASTSSAALGNIYPNANVNIYGEENGFYKIDFMGTKKTYGYVSKDYIKLITDEVIPEEPKPEEPKPEEPKPEEPKPENPNIPVNKDGVVINITSSLNVRTGPGTSHAVKGSLRKDAKVRVNYKTPENWYNISYAGTTGFVSADYIKIVEENNNGGTPEVSVGKDAKVTGITSYLNVRMGAGTSYAVTGRLTAGKSVKVISEVNGWYQISYDGKTGYVSKQYITITDGNNKPEVEVPNGENKIGTVVGITSSLNIRSGAGTNYSVVGSLRGNDKVTVIGEVSGWYKISYASGRVGYVSSQYISLNGGTATSPQSKTGKVVTNSGDLNIRSGRGTNYSVIGVAKRNSTVTIIDNENGWYKIQAGNVIGYVKADYIQAL